MSKRPIIIVILVLLVAGISGFIYWQKKQQHAAKPHGFPPMVIAATEVKQENRSELQCC